MTGVLFDGRVIAPPPCLAGYPEAEPVPPACAGCAELRELVLTLAGKLAACAEVLAHSAEKRAARLAATGAIDDARS